MIPLLAFVLESVVVAAVVAFAASLVVRLLLPLVTSAWFDRYPALRADGVLLLASVPAAASSATVLAAAAPSLLSALRGVGDHCASHTHHLHFCLIHAGGVRPQLAAVGALLLGVFAVRAALRVTDLLRTRAQLRQLESLGHTREGPFPLIEVPGAALLLHAAGVRRRRILVSSEFRATLTPEEMRCAIAHEEAHLRRRDPLAQVLLLLAGLFMPPAFCRAFRDSWRTASEEASDAQAAHSLGEPMRLAEALVKTATLQHRSLRRLQTPAFGGVALERRVQLLLGAPLSERRSALGLLIVATAAMSALTFALLNAAAVHHAVETLLHGIS